MKILSASKLLKGFLLVLLLGQVLLIYSTLKDKGLNISWLIQVEGINKILPQNTQLKSGDIRFYLPFIIRLPDPNLIYTDGGCHQYKAEYLDIAWAPFLKSQFKFNQWTARSAQGTLQTTYYPQPIDSINLLISLNKNALTVEYLKGQSEDKFLNMALKADPQKILELENSESFTLSDEIKLLLDCIYHSKKTNLLCDIDLTKKDASIIEFKVASDSIHWKELRLKNSQINGLIKNKSINLRTKASKIFHGNYAFEGHYPEARIKIENGILESINFDLHSIKAGLLKVGHSFGSIETANKSEIAGSAFFSHQGAPTSAEFQYDFTNETISLDLVSYLNKALALSALKDFNMKFNLDDYLIKDPEPIFLKMDLLLGKDFALEKAKGNMAVNALSINEFHIDHISSDFELDSSEELTSKTHLRTKRGPADIEASINRARGSYLFTIEGFAAPNDYNSIAPKWWKNTFKAFTFNDNCESFGEFSILGHFKNNIPNLFIGRAIGSNITYRGVNVKTSDLLVQGHDYITKVRIKEAHTETGKASGIIQLAVKPDGFTKPESVQLDLISELSLEDSQALFGENIRTIISHFKTNATPLVRLDSVIFNDYYTEHKDKSYYNLNISTDKPFLFMDRPFEDLNIEVYGRENNHYLRSAVAAFSKGTLKFNADITETDSEDPQLRIDLEIIDSESRLAAKNLIQPFNLESRETSVEEVQTKVQKLNAALKSKGSLLNLSNHKGFGQLDISGNGLAQIHLLGPFSKALNELKIPIGSFGLNKLNSWFYINKEIVGVHHLEINGDQTEVLGNGSYNINDQSINFDIKVDILKNAFLSFSNLGIFGELFNPIKELLSFTVTGTPDKQIWRSRFDPRNLFE
jgi:hypothetical protein